MNMKEIKCPKCGEVITVDDSTFAAILDQVRTSQFNEEIERRTKEVKEMFESKEDAMRSSVEKDFEKKLSEKDSEMSNLRNELTRLNGIIDGFEATKKSELSALEASKSKEFFDTVSEKDKRISELEATISKNENAHKVAILEEQNASADKVQAKEKRIIELESEIKADRLAAEKRENEIREQSRLLLSDKDAEINRLKEFKLRLSTKMVGETLEQHCSIKFEEAQSNGQFPNAVFMKDNVSIEGTKGDFIFRDYIDDNEYVSIMFEMKNEMDATATKHRNDDFLEKLDKDRHRKNCEYAVLVSMLEQDNELYNNGIVDKSHRFPKMIVIRPQFFIPVLRLISECAKKGFLERNGLMKELEAARNQSLDFANFEDRINRFRQDFSNRVVDAHKKYEAANEGIDKVIESLEKQIKALRQVKANFEASEQKLLKANEMAEEKLTVKKLTHGVPSIRKLIEDSTNP